MVLIIPTKARILQNGCTADQVLNLTGRLNQRMLLLLQTSGWRVLLDGTDYTILKWNKNPSNWMYC
jgi:hypothetical protein